MKRAGVTLASFASCTVLAIACSSTTPQPSATSASTPDAGAQETESPARPPTKDDDDATLPPIDMTGPIGGSRPGQVILPPDFDASNPAAKSYPLVIVLHGYSTTGDVENGYLRLSDEASKLGYVTLILDGLVDKAGEQYWNGSDACCDLYGTGVDDVSYIRDTLRQVQARYAIDAKRTYIFGHSNGAFMAHTFACLQSNRIAGIAALAGAVATDTAACTPAHPVAVLTIHGTVDETISYSGGTVKHAEPKSSVPYPSAATTIATWAARNGCASTPTTDAPRDYDSLVDGAETTPTRYDGCKPGGAAELWTLVNGKHVPTFTDTFMPDVFAFWAAHPRL